MTLSMQNMFFCCDTDLYIASLSWFFYDCGPIHCMATMLDTHLTYICNILFSITKSIYFTTKMCF